MSGCYWLRKLTVRGFLIGCLIWSGVALGQSDDKAQAQGGEDRATEIATDTKPDFEVGLPPPITGLIERIATALEAIEAKDEPADKTEREKADLKAQGDMAKWSFWMMLASFLAAALTGVGVALIWWTLGETRRAANYTEGMLNEAKLTTLAAQATVEETRKNAERQLRAYVMVESANIKKLKIGEIPEVSVTLKNFGQTPAYDVRVWGVPGFQDFPLKGGLPTERPDETDDIVAAPLAPTVPQTIPLIFKRTMNEETIRALKAGSHAIFVVGQARYIDAFKVERETDFCLFIGGPIGIANGFANYEIGNRAT
ncbi:hypothetical protein KFF05_07920 [bacterium SCSIO 12827]|nr:hypothetical protein KFF05_07920 [bacterium SCSIO 12827]